MFTILLVDDDPADAGLTRAAIGESKLVCSLNHVGDGEAALAYLRSQPAPDLVLLDLNMPRKNGYEVLREMRADEQLRDIPVVVLTTSDSPMDVKRCYALGANSFVTKPVDLEDFLQAVRAIEDYWFSVVRLPGGKRP